MLPWPPSLFLPIPCPCFYRVALAQFPLSVNCHGINHVSSAGTDAIAMGQSTTFDEPAHKPWKERGF